ncbi:MAG: general stress protein, partial [Thermomicrobiales bacterium]
MARRTVIGIFQQAGQAERALKALRAAGFTANHVSVVAKDTDAVTPVAPATETGLGGRGRAPGLAASPVACSAGSQQLACWQFLGWVQSSR